MDLSYSLFLLLRKDAWIYNNLKSNEGRKLMKDLVRFKTTEADLEAVRKFKRGGG